MIIIEFRLTHSILLDALEQAPDMQITWERSNAIDDSQVRFTIWAEGGDFDTFRQGLREDPTVTVNPLEIDVDDRRLYQLELTDVGLQKSVYPVFVETGAIIQTLTATHEGWEFRVEFPSQDSLDYFIEFCRENELDLTVHRLYEERSARETRQYGLSDPQQETLEAAIDCGYLEIPRESSLRQLSDRLGISKSAASERFRRAVETLIEYTIYRTNDVQKPNHVTE